MAKIAKRTAAARKAVEGKANLAVAEAVALVKANATAKFDETLEIAMNLGVDPRHADQMVRGVVNLPNGTGKTVRVAVFARGAKADEATAAGADIVGAEDLMETIQGGKIDFDRAIATPDMMPIVGRLGKILGPRNLMPNPKVGTVTMDVAQAVKNAKGGEVQFKVEKAGVIHGGVGKASFEPAAAGRERQGLRAGGEPGEALGRQGHLPEEDRALLDHGAGRDRRRRQRGRRVTRSPAETPGCSGRATVRLSETVGWARARKSCPRRGTIRIRRGRPRAVLAGPVADPRRRATGETEPARGGDPEAPNLEQHCG